MATAKIGCGPEREPLRPEPVEGRGLGTSTSSARTAGNGQAAPKAPEPPAPKAPERPQYGPPAGSGRMFGQARAVEKSLNFLPSLKRLLGHLAPERMILILAVLLAVIGIVMNVLGPRILGMATDVIFTGILGKDLPSGESKEAGGR